jgi:hypothetical protein
MKPLASPRHPLARFLPLLPLLLLARLATGAEASPQADFDQANEANLRGDYPTAEAGYRGLLDAGFADGHVYYNLGNTLYRQGWRGGAILAWRRAELLLPRDPDLSANLEKARDHLQDALEPPRVVPDILFWQRSLSVREGRVLGAFCMGLSLGLLLLRRLGETRLPRLRAGASSLLGFAIPLGLLGSILIFAAVFVDLRRSAEPSCVVLVESLTARSTPAADGVDLFELHEGAEARRIQGDLHFTLIALADGRRGWVPAEGIGIVDLRAPMPTRASAAAPSARGAGPGPAL